MDKKTLNPFMEKLTQNTKNIINKGKTLVKDSSPEAEKITENVKHLFNQGKTFINEKTSALRNKSNEDTGDLLPVITLTGDREVLKVSKLPSVIGRNRNEVDVYLFDNTISREHSEVLFYEGAVLISDKGSVYGTYLNGEKLIPGEYYELYDGDQVKFGDKEFTASLNQVLIDSKYNSN